MEGRAGRTQRAAGTVSAGVPVPSPAHPADHAVMSSDACRPSGTPVRWHMREEGSGH